MRIAISGAQSTGKTTLARDLAEAIPNTRVEPEPFRVLRNQLGLVSGADSMTPEQEMALIEHSGRRMQALRAGETVVYDRCGLDALAHALVAADMGNPAFTSEWLRTLEEATNTAMKPLTLLVVVPVSDDLPLEDDGVRSTDLTYQKAVDQRIRSLASEFPRVMEVNGTRAERVSRILDRVDPEGRYGR